MKVIKPLQVSFFPTFHRIAGDWYQFHTGLIGWDLLTGDTRTEIDIWKAAGPLVSQQIPIDEFFPKLASEFLVSGSFFSRRNTAVEAGHAEVRVGDTTKRLDIFGERNWKRHGGVYTTFTTPKPLHTLPLTWQYAFGGEDLLNNPVGMGYREDEAGQIWPLPQVELHADLIGSPDNVVTPGSFLPLPVTYPDRIKLAGTYKEDYLEKYFPGYPADFDARFFNRAPTDQWVEQDLVADCEFYLKNLHPNRPELSGKIPDFEMRSFLGPNAAEQSDFSELALKPDTVWFFPEAELGVLIFHGSQKTSHHDWDYLDTITVAYERKSQTRKSVKHYQSATSNRSKSKIDELALLFKGEDLIPKNEKTLLAMFSEDSDSQLKMYGVDRNVEAAKEKAREKLDEEEQRVAALKSQAATASKKEAEVINQQVVAFESMNKRLRSVVEGGGIEEIDDPKLKKIAQLQSDLAPRKSDGSIDLEKIDLTKINELNEAVKEMSSGPSGSYEDKKKEILAQVENKFNDQIDQLKNSPEIKEGLEKLPPEQRASFEDSIKDTIASAKEKFAEVEELIRQTPKITLPRPPALPAVKGILLELSEKRHLEEGVRLTTDYLKANHPGEEAMVAAVAAEAGEMRKEEIPNIEAITDFLENTLPKAEEGDLLWHSTYAFGAHKMPIGVSSHGDTNEQLIARLENASGSEHFPVSTCDCSEIILQNKTVTDKDLSRIYLEQSKLTNVTFIGCSFEQAILTRGDFQEVVFKDCDFSKANLGDTKLNNVRFDSCNMDETVLSSARINSTTFYNCNFVQNIISKAQMINSVFDTSSFLGVIFEGGAINQTQFKSTTLERVIAQSVEWDQVKIDDSSIVRCIWIQSTLKEMSITKTTGDKAFLGSGTTVYKAKVSDSTLVMMNFRDLDLRGSVFKRCSLTYSDFSNGVFSGSVWEENILKECRFLKTNLQESLFQKCDFTNSNMQDADLRDCQFFESRLFSVQFLHAKIGGASFSECNLERTLLENWSP